MNIAETVAAMALLNAIDNFRATLLPRYVRNPDELEAKQERDTLATHLAQIDLDIRIRTIRHLMATTST